MDFGISDYQPLFCTRKLVHPTIGSHNTIKIRLMKHYTFGKYCNVLRETSWFEVIECDEVETAWTKFRTLFTDILDKVAPGKTIRTKQRSQP